MCVRYQRWTFSSYFMLIIYTRALFLPLPSCTSRIAIWRENNMQMHFASLRASLCVCIAVEKRRQQHRTLAGREQTEREGERASEKYKPQRRQVEKVVFVLWRASVLSAQPGVFLPLFHYNLFYSIHI